MNTSNDEKIMMLLNNMINNWFYLDDAFENAGFKVNLNELIDVAVKFSEEHLQSGYSQK